MLLLQGDWGGGRDGEDARPGQGGRDALRADGGRQREGLGECSALVTCFHYHPVVHSLDDQVLGIEALHIHPNLVLVSLPASSLFPVCKCRPCWPPVIWS